MTETGRGGARRIRLNRDDIVTAALEMSEGREGLDAITVRSLAHRLEVGAATLYGHFRSKEEILDAMADAVLGDFELPAVDGEDPATAIRRVAEGFLWMMSEHPGVVELLATRSTRSERSLRGAMEVVICRLTESGLNADVAVQCYGFLIQHAMGFVSYRAPRPWGGELDEGVAELRRQQEHFYASLPAGDFPHVVGQAAKLVLLPSRTTYDFAVDALVSHVARCIGE